jgi:von Willebrand factor type A domain-containing protein
MDLTVPEQERRHRRWIKLGATIAMTLALVGGTALTLPSADAAASQAVDVLFVFDTTGSMGAALAEAKAQVTDAIASVREKYPDSDFGLATVGDYDPGDTPWALKQPLTSDSSKVQTALDPLAADGGGDSPEAYGRALFEAATNTGIGWRAGAKQILILVNDDVPHDNDLNEGVPADIQDQPSPWDTGTDAGTDATVGTADDIDWQAQLAALKAKGIIFATVFYSGSSTYQPYWDWWTKQTGGSTTVGGGTTSLGDILAELIDDTVSGGSDPLDVTAWAPGDVHVHSAGDTSLRDNLLCRQNVAGFPKSGKGTVTTTQEQACATYLVDRTLKSAKGHGLKWVILSEHGVWLGVQAPGADYKDYLKYSEPEARSEWNMIRQTASGRAAPDGVRALIGEEIGSAPPATTSGHFSTYSALDYIKDGPTDNSEGKFLQSVKAASAWGAINHPGTGSTWGCWFTSDQKPIYDRRGRPIGTECSDGIAADYPDQVKALEVYTGSGQPIGDVLDRWDGLLNRGLKVAAVGGGDTHSVKRCGLDDVVKSCKVLELVPGPYGFPVWRWNVKYPGDQIDGSTDALGTDGRARTWVLAGGLTPAAGFAANDANDPVRLALKSGMTLASNGPVAGVALDGKAPTSDAYLPYSAGGHKLEVTWNPSQPKASGASGSYGRATKVRLVIGQIVDGKFKADCGNARNPYRQSDCTTTNIVLDSKHNAPITTSANLEKLSFSVPQSWFKTFKLAGPPGYSVQYTPATFARVEIEFGSKRGVYSSPFYIQGNANQIPNF